MPLINGDAKALEWVCALFLSQDKVGMNEYISGVDIHSVNQHDLHLPSRLIAKTFLFRLIYGGSDYAYANDPSFVDAKLSQKQWAKVIEKTYDKYRDLGKWHIKIVQEVVNTGRLVMPTGREYHFQRMNNGDFPRTKILNYPVQGLGADLLAIARVSLMKRMKRLGLKSLFVCTVHDSILIDAPQEEVAIVCKLMYDVFRDIPLNFQRLFEIEFNLPLKVEVQVGKTWGDMIDIDKEILYEN